MTQNPFSKIVTSREFFVFATIAVFILAFVMGLNHVLTAQKQKFNQYQQAIWINVTTEETLNTAHKSFMQYHLASHKNKMGANEQYQNLLSAFLKFERLLPLYDEMKVISNVSDPNTEQAYFAGHYQKIITLSDKIRTSLPHQQRLFTEQEYDTINLNFTRMILTIEGLTTASLNNKNVLGNDSQGDQERFLLYIALVVACGLGMTYLVWGQNNQIESLRAQFYQAQKMEALGRLAGGIAHDFNNVLAAIMGYTELLIEDLEEMPEQRTFATQISAAGKQAQQLVEQILAYSRHSQANLQTIDIVKEVNDVFTFFEKSANAGISVSYKCPFEKAYIKGNSNHIHQVLMNICVNANDVLSGTKGRIKINVNYVNTEHPFFHRLAADKGGKSTSQSYPNQNIIKNGHQRALLIGRIDPDDAYISIKISDNGEGIDQGTLQQIFDPFFTTKSASQGTGLGLSAALGIISEHKGVIIVSTAPEDGTSFEIMFPLTDAQTIAPEQTSHTFSKLSDIKGSGTIMLVEDEMTVAMMTCQLLERMGYDTIHCLDGREALEALEDDSQEYNLVITDYKMPHMTGIQLAHEIKKQRPALPIIMISGYSDEKLQPLVTETSIQAVLNKPVDKDKLAATVSDALLKP